MRLWRIWQWFRPSPRCAGLHVVLFTRQGCHLCDTAWQRLLARQPRYGLRLDKVDVDSDPELAACYGLDVPVVVIDGRVRFRGDVNEVLLDRLLRAEFTA